MTATTTRRTAPKALVDAARAAVLAELTLDTLGRVRIHGNRGTCDRCGGSGRMPYAAYGGVCFGCNGRGYVYSRAARRSLAALDEYRREVYAVPVSEVRPGDRIRQDGGSWRTVVGVDAEGGCRMRSGGPDAPWVTLVAIHTQKVTLNVAPDSTVSRYSREAALAAVRYAATLDGVQVSVAPLVDTMLAAVSA